MTPALDGIDLFVLNDSAGLGASVCSALGLCASPLEQTEFEDGEHKARPLTDVRGRDVYVLQSLYGDPRHSADDKLCRLLFLIAALRDAAAARVTAVVPYPVYSRKDRRTKRNDSLSTRYVAALVESMGADAIMTMDVHNQSAFQNAFRCHTEHLFAHSLFVDAIAPIAAGRPVCVVAPDAGAIHRASQFRLGLSAATGTAVGSAFAEKVRRAGQLSGDMLVGEVGEHDVVIVDDMIASGNTLARTAVMCAARGARRVYGLATHGLFTGDACRTLAEAPLNRLFVTDTVPPFRLAYGTVREKLQVLSCGALVADAIRDAHVGAFPVRTCNGPRVPPPGQGS
ncbi:ribose-phosphate diphosphokinase [Massilia scottii]|uniref:ribose-phosphate diphosphokinase n=1 Tax=Massilia scottii TaxID=3057166 RepID=UPI0027969470|nr:ribose-phosphate diphosphokinase [Massilia sp. CCM 9029]MDQ1829127.1 ribose-phosphate diphosphokinase [Massilia sp. CCM 9029]